MEQEKIVVPLKNEKGEEYASNKSHSITISDLAEGFKFKYKTYYAVFTIKTHEFVCKVKSPVLGQKYIDACGCSKDWIVVACDEPEEVLAERTTQKRFQCQGAHKFLDFHQRNKEAELDYDRKEQTRMNRIVKAQEDRKFKTKMERRFLKGESLADGELESYEVRGERRRLQGKHGKADLLNKLMGRK